MRTPMSVTKQFELAIKNGEKPEVFNGIPVEENEAEYYDVIIQCHKCSITHQYQDWSS